MATIETIHLEEAEKIATGQYEESKLNVLTMGCIIKTLWKEFQAEKKAHAVTKECLYAMQKANIEICHALENNKIGTYSVTVEVK